ncbi:MAG: tetrathionate reductase family octaheme c-type cytochrome [Gammaproteobacteria bacterium]|nr:tetrathionate reductase family octaheme c-type cytochrome [Gammaproteobacteria bacterium]
MKLSENRWLFGLATIVLIFSVSIWIFTEKSSVQIDEPWEGVPVRPAHVDHKALFTEPFKTGQEVTKACLVCHEDAAQQVLHTSHWRWESDPVQLEGREGLIATGKKNTINNFCIGIRGNWESCTACHAGYGWEDEKFDFTNADNVDCLVCHDQSGTYKKGKKGNPVKGVNLLEVAQSVAIPSRENCGGCHFRGGGGNAVKHGDLDESLFYPSEELDVHMGRYDFYCVDCHKTKEHNISGRSISVSVDNHNQIACIDCHNNKLHEDERLNAHTDTVACQTCHIPLVAKEQATKTHWDWSEAGDSDREEDSHHYLKIKGSFIYKKNLKPTYLWYNGLADRYLLGDKIDANQMTPMNLPKGHIGDPKAKIWPFKVHWAKQPYDSKLNHLLQPKTVGKEGYWSDFDWDKALRLGANYADLEYSGEFGFAETQMYWPLTHMVAPKEEALQCKACHSDKGILDWQALGFPGDPVKWGSTERARLIKVDLKDEVQLKNSENMGGNNE